MPILLWSLSGYRSKAGLIAPAAAAGATGVNFTLKAFGAKHIYLYDVVDSQSRVDEAVEFVSLDENGSWPLIKHKVEIS